MYVTSKKGGIVSLWAQLVFFFGYRKPNVRLKSFEKSSFEARGFLSKHFLLFHRALMIRVFLLDKVMDSKGCLTM